MRMIGLAAIAALALSGCGHTLVLTPQDGGPGGGSGKAPATMGYSGTMTINLDGKPYTGEWVLKSQGGGMGITTGTVTASGQTAIGTGTSILTSAEGSGRAFLRSADNESLRCVFDFNEWSSTGVGVCQHSGGRGYDLIIR